MESLTPLIGRWKIKDGALVPKWGGEHRLAFGDKDWKDYEIKTNVTLSEGMGYGVYYRTDGERDISGYILYDPGYGNSFLVQKIGSATYQVMSFSSTLVMETLFLYER